MMRFRKHLQNYGVKSLRSLADNLHTSQRPASAILKVAAIHHKFNEIGGATVLGPPVSEVKLGEGIAERSYFSGAKLRVTDSGVMTMEDLKLVKIDYQGFRCDRESSELSTQDEPYLIIGIVPSGRVQLVGPVSVDAENQYTDGHGTIVGINDSLPVVPIAIDVVIREHDFGNPEEARKAVADATTKVRDDIAALATAASQQGDGIQNQELANFVGLMAAPNLMGTLTPIITAVFGLEDDAVGHYALALFDETHSGKNAVSPPVLGQVQGLNYNVVAPLIGEENQGAGVYTVYFFVTVEIAPKVVWQDEM
jgi:hypothetical protein